jgi:hypothetical protein
MDEDDLEDFWRDYLTKLKQVYQGLTCDELDDVDDNNKISSANMHIRLCCYIKLKLSLQNVNVFSY